MDVFQLLSSVSSSVSSSGSWGSLQRASSLYSHQQSRNFAKLAVDSVNLAAAVRTGRLTDSTMKGEIYDHVQAELGQAQFNNLCADGGLALVTICYCQRGLEHFKERFSKEKLEKDSGNPVLSDAVVQDVEKMRARAVINHDYLVLVLQPGDPQSKKFYILAEKLAVGGSQGKPGIFITYRNSEEESLLLLNEQTKLYAINCGQSLHVPLQAILKILAEVNADYSLRNANCWDYATTTAKKLALKCAEVAGISATDRDRLTRESRDLEATLNKKNMKNIASTVMAWSSARFSS